MKALIEKHIDEDLNIEEIFVATTDADNESLVNSAELIEISVEAENYLLGNQRQNGNGFKIFDSAFFGRVLTIDSELLDKCKHRDKCAVICSGAVYFNGEKYKYEAMQVVISDYDHVSSVDSVRVSVFTSTGEYMMHETVSYPSSSEDVESTAIGILNFIQEQSEFIHENYLD